MIAIPPSWPLFLTPPHGPHAAREAAEQLVADGHHAHLVAEDQSICMVGTCEPTGAYR